MKNSTDGTFLISRTLTALAIVAVLMISSVPADAPSSEGAPLPWWADTVMDDDGDGIHDAVEMVLEDEEWADEISDGRISVLVDFDHTPTEADEQLLVQAVGFEPRFRFHVMDIISGSVAVDRVDDLMDVPGVVFVSWNAPVHLMLDEAVPQHNMPVVWDLGYTGDGMNIAVIDTGIDGTHVGIDDFDDDPLTYDPKVIAFYDAINNPDVTDGSTTPYDDHGHGSHCAGISAGTGAPDYQYVGIAPGSALIGVKVLDGGGSGSFDQVMMGMQWCIDKKDEFNIRAATMSLGGPWLSELTQAQEDRLTEMANKMVREGIALCIAAGNDALYGTIGTPGAAKDVITVGATDHNRQLAIYSSKGPTHEGLIKPNVAGVGGGAGVGSGGVMSVAANTGSEYTAMSGTSMATPLVAGIMTVLLEANPDLDPLTVRDILEYTAEFRFLLQPIRPNNEYGWGFVEADAALAEAVQVDPNLNIELDPEPERRNFSDNRSRFYAEQYDLLTFAVEGNASYIEWRYVDDDEHGWHEVVEESQDPDIMQMGLVPELFLPGNHSFWVRAHGDNGHSSPVHVEIHIAEGQAQVEEKSSDDDPDYIPYIFGAVIIVAVIAFAVGRRSKD